jgi:ankyrin repeat protein
MILKLLLDAGADKDAQDEYLRTPLHWAAIKNREEIAKLLVDAGAKLDIKDGDDKTPYDLTKNDFIKKLTKID